MVTAVAELWVCTSCMLLHANGECDPDDTDAIKGYERWHAEHPEWHLAMGGEHNDECTPEDREEGCDCGHIEFTRMACGVCGTWLAGTRYAMTAFEH